MSLIKEMGWLFNGVVISGPKHALSALIGKRRIINEPLWFRMKVAHFMWWKITTDTIRYIKYHRTRR